MHEYDAQTIDEIVLEAAEARGRTLTRAAVDQYATALRGTPRDTVRQALANIFARERLLDMPAPRVILDEVRSLRARERRSADAAAEPRLSDADERFAALQAPLGRDYLSGRITQGEYASAICAIARNCRLAPDQVASIEDQLADWRGSGERIGPNLGGAL